MTRIVKQGRGYKLIKEEVFESDFDRFILLHKGIKCLVVRKVKGKAVFSTLFEEMILASEYGGYNRVMEDEYYSYPTIKQGE